MTRPARLARWCTSLGAACLLAFASLQAHADAGELRARHDEMRDQLRNNNFGRQLHIDSAETSNSLQGDVYAVLDHPFERVKSALQDPDAWCDIMLLPFNTRACDANGNSLTVRIGRRPDQPVGQAPFGTRDYRISAEAVPLENGKTFMHMRYSYGYGGAGRFAMQAYLATAGANKVGFTTNGVRGAVERNAMRYYLAIDAFLDTMDMPVAQRVDRRINQWFSATERYPRQLREMDRASYLSVKRDAYGKQQTASAN